MQLTNSATQALISVWHSWCSFGYAATRHSRSENKKESDAVNSDRCCKDRIEKKTLRTQGRRMKS